MITVKKLLTLKERTRLRKVSMIAHEAAVALKNGQEIDYEYINDVLNVAGFEALDVSLNADSLAFRLEDVSQALLARLGAEPSDWDFRTEEGELDSSRRVVQDKVLVLDRVRSPYNVGAIFRSAEAFGIARIILVEGTASPEHVRAQRTSRGTTDVVPWEFMPEAEVVSFLKSYDSEEIIALELGGTSINEFAFPKRGVSVLGSEEFGISPEILSCCGSRVSIPMGGSKGSLNVSVAAGILLQRWFSIDT
ncbi:MAG: TrmH family RNA methyltransferase [Spirochaetales bacterium]|nr:TrmH family RNA methyltransferase [Spirochaetales bacterium]